MPRATLKNGQLAPLTNCYILTPCGNICLRILPEISDSKGANYMPENIPGRVTPILTYAYSEQRTISSELHFMVTGPNDITNNFTYMAIIRQLVYPGPATAIAPFTPPPVARFVCGHLLDGADGLCVILKSYSMRYPTDVAWDDLTCLPYRFTVSCNWDVVYTCEKLPTNDCVVTDNSGSVISGEAVNSSSGFGIRGFLPR